MGVFPHKKVPPSKREDRPSVTWNFAPMWTAIAESERLGRDVDLRAVTPSMIMRHFPECDPYRGSSGEYLSKADPLDVPLSEREEVDPEEHA